MATTTPNYGWDVPTSTDYVKDGATAIETLGDDIDASMYAALNGKPAGLVLLNTSTLSAAASLTVDSVFSATYDDYIIMVDITTAANTALDMILRKSGADLTGSTYYCNYYYINIESGSTGASASGATTAFKLHQANVCRSFNGSLEVHVPFATSYTFGKNYAAQSDAGTLYSFQGGFVDKNARSADGFKLSTASSTMTGTVRVFGVKNS